MVKVSRIATDYTEAGAMNGLIGLWGFLSEGDEDSTFLTKSGEVGAVIRVVGVDAEGLDHPQIDQIARRFEAALRIFDERFRVYQYLLKRDQAEIPHRGYSNPVVQTAIQNRVAYLEAKSESLYTVEVFFVVLYEEWHQNRNHLERLRQLLKDPRASLREALSTGQAITILEADLERAREVLSNKAASFVVQLQDAVGIEIATKTAAYAFFRRLLNLAPHKAAVPLRHDTHLDYFVCDSLLECHRDHLRIDDYSVQVLTLKEPPAQTFAHLLSALQEIPSNAIIVSE